MRFLFRGWRVVNHSFAMVHQHQLTAALKLQAGGSFRIVTQDLPFYSSSWTNAPSPAENYFTASNGVCEFSEEASQHSFFQATYTAAYPFGQSSNELFEIKQFQFMVTNYGLNPFDLALPRQELLDWVGQESLKVVTPSAWCVRHLQNFGIDEKAIVKVHHGVAPDVFYPFSADQRQQLRAALGISPDDYCFLNLGAVTANKGIDRLIAAFVQVYRRHPHVRLILKDLQALYGTSAMGLVEQELGRLGLSQDSALRSRFTLVSQNFTLAQMASLFNLADCYVSPYMAEGFNLPVLEAMACGLRVLATEGGATDEFLFDANSKISARPMYAGELATDDPLRERLPQGSYLLEPNLDDLIEKMSASCTQVAGQDQLIESKRVRCDFSWEKVTTDLLREMGAAV